MSDLTVTVVVNGAAGTSLAVSVYPQSDFIFNPQRTWAPPNASPTATGTTNSSGVATLTGLSSVAYNLLVVDARGVNNWFPVPAYYVGGSYTAIIPWSTPVSVTDEVSTGGDTPGGPAGTYTRWPWAWRDHIHQVATVVAPPVQTFPLMPSGEIYGIVVTSPGNWWIVGSSLEVVGGSDAYDVMSTSKYGASWVPYAVSSLGNPNSGTVSKAGCIAWNGDNGVIGWSTSNDGAWISYTTDGGSAWTAVEVVSGTIGSGTYASINTVWIDASTGNVIVGTNLGHVFVSTNQGATWSDVTPTLAGLTSGEVQCTVISGDGAGNVFAGGIGADIPTNNYGWIASSSDGGAVFTTQSQTLGLYPAGLAVSSIDDAFMACYSTSSITGGSASGLYQSSNGGSTWTLVDDSWVVDSAAYTVLNVDGDYLLLGQNTGNTSDSGGYYAALPYSSATAANIAPLWYVRAVAVDGSYWLFGGDGSPNTGPFAATAAEL